MAAMGLGIGPIWRRRLCRALRVAAGRTALTLVLALLNPFGVLQWSESRSYEYWQRLYAPHYDPPSASRRSAREDITVVFLDDHEIGRLARGRPLDSVDVATMIDDLVHAGGPNAAPLAIFVDLLLAEGAPRDRTAAELVRWTPAQADACRFGSRAEQDSAFRCLLVTVADITAYDRWKNDPSCRPDNLRRILCIQRYGGIPVIFADPRLPGTADPAAPTAAGLAALAEVAATAPVAVEKRGYDILAPRPGGPPDSGITLFPAAALYGAYCGVRSCNRGVPVVDAGAGAAWSPSFRRPIDVIWGVGAPSAFTRMRDALGGRPGESCVTAESLRRNFLPELLSMLGGGVRPGRDVRPPCLYTHAIPYRLLQAEMTLGQVRQALGGRVVLLGAQLSDSNDIVPAPPYGALPGVYYHAMALDNLIQRGADYPRMAQKVSPYFALTWTDVATIAALFAVAFAFGLLAAGMAERNADAARPISVTGWLRRCGVLATSVMVVLALTFTLSRGQGLVPENFNIAAIVLVCLLGLRDFAGEVLAPVWRRGSPVSNWTWFRRSPLPK